MKRRRLALALALCTTFFGVLYLRQLVGAHHHYRLARADSDPARAFVQLSRALAFWAPLNPFSRKAETALYQQVRAEVKAQHPRALEHAIDLRSRLLARRPYIDTHGERLSWLNPTIASLMAADPQASQDLRTPEGQTRLRERLFQPQDPAPLGVGLALVGFCVWIVAALSGTLIPLKPRRRWALFVSAAVGFGLLCLGLATA